MEKAIAAAKGKIAFVKVNVDGAGKLADRERIECVPTLRLYGKGLETSEFCDEIRVKVLHEWFAWFLGQKPKRAARTAKKKN